LKSLKRILAESIAKKAINEIKDSPERKSRNLVDLALNLAEGQYFRDFLLKVQKILQDENTPYYRMVIDAMNHINTDRILTFGMNIGYNSVTVGSPKIRAIEQEENFDIPWSMYLDAKKFNPSLFKSYSKLFSEAVELGIYSWHISADENLFNLLKLLKEHEDCAFVLFVDPDLINDELIRKAENINNLMFAVKYKEGAEDACRLLRSNMMLYSVYYSYTDNDEDIITSDEFILSIENLRPLFTIFTPNANCNIKTVDKIYSYVKETRLNQKFITIPWDALNDTRYIDGKISENICSAGVNAEGLLFRLKDNYSCTDLKVFEIPLHEALKKALPKS